MTRRNTHLQQTLGRIVTEKYGGNLSALARAVRVAPSTVKRWVNDGMVPKTDVMPRLCKELKMSSSDLLGDSEPPSARREISDEIRSSEQATAMDWFISEGYDADAVAIAASIVARRAGLGTRRSALWWVNEMDVLLRRLG